MVICLERGADLHMAQLMPLPLTVSCSSKIQIGFTFLCLAYLQRVLLVGFCELFQAIRMTAFKQSETMKSNFFVSLGCLSKYAIMV